jgi:DNA-binding transcriptional MerR regulator
MSTLVSIGDFARMTLLSVKALRHYHDVGLLAPAAIDSDTGYRRYAVEQVPTAQAIRRLRELGMPIDEIRVVIRADDVVGRNDALTRHLRRMEAELAATRATVASLRRLLDEASPGPMAVTYRTDPPIDALVLCEIVTADTMFGWLSRALESLRTAEHQPGIQRSGPDGALYSAELLEDERGELAAVLPMTGEGRPNGRIERTSLRPVEYAVAIHAGPLDDIDRTYAALGAVVAERAIGVAGAIRENYLVSSFDTPNEEEHRTEVCWPVFQTVDPARSSGR